MRSIGIEELDFTKVEGLIPVVTQDSSTGQVLMVAYTNREALEATVETGYAHYWSRSRGTLWKKGDTSGNIQKVEEVLVDCDTDTLIFKVRQKGVACHTGERSCFYRELFEFRNRSS